MADPSDLLDVARLLCDGPGGAKGTDAHLRRAVSTAYYAMFHTLLRAAAERFIGSGQEHTAAFKLIYRGFEHRRIREFCEAIQATTLNRRFQEALGRSSVGPEMRGFAVSLPQLQDARHLADYGPTGIFLQSDAESVIDTAARAIAAFHSAPEFERTDVLALMMVRQRT